MSFTDAEFQALYDQYAPAVYARCRSICGTKQEAEEAFQETFYKVWMARGRLRKDRAPLAYLFTVARNESITQIRKRQPWRDDPFAWLQLPDPGTVDPVVHSTLGRLLTQISAHDAALLRLRHVEELTIDELAEVLGTSARTVRRKLTRLLARTRAALAVEAA